MEKETNFIEIINTQQYSKEQFIQIFHENYKKGISSEVTYNNLSSLYNLQYCVTTIGKNNIKAMQDAYVEFQPLEIINTQQYSKEQFKDIFQDNYNNNISMEDTYTNLSSLYNSRFCFFSQICENNVKAMQDAFKEVRQQYIETHLKRGEEYDIKIRKDAIQRNEDAIKEEAIIDQQTRLKIGKNQEEFKKHVDHEWKLCQNNKKKFIQKIKTDEKYADSLKKYSRDENGIFVEKDFEDRDYDSLYEKCKIKNRQKFEDNIRNSEIGKFILSGLKTGGKRKTIKKNIKKINRNRLKSIKNK